MAVSTDEKPDAEENDLFPDLFLSRFRIDDFDDDVDEAEVGEEVLPLDDFFLIRAPIGPLPLVNRLILLNHFLILILPLNQPPQQPKHKHANLRINLLLLNINDMNHCPSHLLEKDRASPLKLGLSHSLNIQNRVHQLVKNRLIQPMKPLCFLDTRNLILEQIVFFWPCLVQK